MPSPKYAAYESAAPYFDLVRGALGDLVDGEHFFDIVTKQVVEQNATTFGKPGSVQRIDFPGRGFQ
jgi:hypothetical protein